MNLFSSSPDSRPALPPSWRMTRGQPLTWLWQIALLLLAFYVFMVALQLMIGSFNLAGGSLALTLVKAATNPFTSLFIGLLATAVVQSSSTSTSLIVTFAAAGGLRVDQAALMIMGANIGTALTSTIVSLGHIGDRREFRQAFSAASLHDLFNIITVLLLFGLEVSTGVFSAMAEGLAAYFGTAPLLKEATWLFFTRDSANFLLNLASGWPYLTLLLALLILFLALNLLTFVLRSLIIGRVQQHVDRFLFGRPLRGLASGFFTTVALQSSSLTTSMIVPLVATEKVALQKAFPFIMGANVGTTTTALLAALVAGSNAALAAAFTHLLFNLCGVLLMYPIPRLRAIPVRLAEALGELAFRNRLYGVAYVVIVFFMLPFLLIFLAEGLGWLR